MVRIILLLLVLPFSANAGDTWFNYTDGNPVQDVAVQDDAVWCATSGGVVRWDKSTMNYTIYNVMNGLSHNLINTICVDSNNHIWAGTEGGGVCEYDGSQWIHHGHDEGLGTDDVKALAFGADGSVYVAGYGLWRYQGGGWERLTYSEPDTQYYSVAVNERGEIWAGHSEGLDYYDIDNYLPQFMEHPEWISFPLPDELPDKWIREICIDGDDLWVGTFDGLAWLHEEQWTVYLDIGTVVTDIICGPDEAIWVSTHQKDPGDGGIWRFDGVSWERYGEILQSFNGIAIDEDYTVWSGMHSGGDDSRLSRMHDAIWDYYTTNPALNDKIILALRETASGDILFGTRNGLSRYSDGSFSPVFHGETFGMITTGSDSKLYLTKGIEGLYRLEDDELVQVGGLRPQYISSMAFAPDGDIYAGLSSSPTTDSGLAVFNGEEWYEIPGQEGNGVIQALTFDSEGTLWTGSLEGLKHRVGSEWTTYSADDLDIPQNIPDRDLYFVTSLASDSNGCIYVGTNLGLYKISGNSSEKMYGSDICDEIRSVIVDYKDRVWCARHIQRQDGWREDRIGCYMNGVYTEYEIPDNEMITRIHSLEITRSNEIWVGTEHGGLFRMIPDEGAFVATDELPQEPILLGMPYPNPFNMSTTIPVRMTEGDNVCLKIYGLNGQKVRTLKDGYVHSGNHSIKWDGNDNLGESVASGYYFVYLKVHDSIETRKLILLK